MGDMVLHNVTCKEVLHHKEILTEVLLNKDMVLHHKETHMEVHNKDTVLLNKDMVLHHKETHMEVLLNKDMVLHNKDMVLLKEILMVVLHKVKILMVVIKFSQK